MIAAFPIGASADFNVTPLLYQSKAMRPTPPAAVTRGDLLPDDLLVFATDAMAQRLLVEIESGTPPDWGRLWDVDQETWRQEIEALRDQDAIVNDDCTLLVLRLPTLPTDESGESEPERVPESPEEPEPPGAADALTEGNAPPVEPAAATAEPESSTGSVAPAGPEDGPDEAITAHERVAHGSISMLTLKNIINLINTNETGPGLLHLFFHLFSGARLSGALRTN